MPVSFTGDLGCPVPVQVHKHAPAVPRQDHVMPRLQPDVRNPRECFSPFIAIEEEQLLLGPDRTADAQMIAGKDAHKPGEAKNSWLTGTAAWNFYAISQFILGIRPHFDGLQINPVIPSAWKGYRVTRKFRGATYHIEINNPDHVSHGVKEVVLNGTGIDDSLVPICDPGSVNDVKVTMG